LPFFVMCQPFRLRGGDDGASGLRVLKGVALLFGVSAFQADDAVDDWKNRLKACHIKEKDCVKPHEHPERVSQITARNILHCNQ